MEQEQKGCETHRIFLTYSLYIILAPFGAVIKYNKQKEGSRRNAHSPILYDDVIKSSGYRIGPFEIESVIMELPYVLECGVSAEPDEVRGQVVKASIVLVKGTEPTEELKKEIQNYVKNNTAPYKYPRIVVFRDELPKTISGKIQRNKL